MSRRGCVTVDYGARMPPRNARDKVVYSVQTYPQAWRCVFARMDLLPQLSGRQMLKRVSFGRSGREEAQRMQARADSGVETLNH